MSYSWQSSQSGEIKGKIKGNTNWTHQGRDYLSERGILRAPVKIL